MYKRQDQKVLQQKEDLDYTHAIRNGLWSATTTLVVGGITNAISNVIHPEAKTGTMDYLFGRDKAKAVVKAQYNNARSVSYTHLDVYKRQLLDTLLTEWEGAASEAYANKFAELRPSFVKGKELIDGMTFSL